MKFWKLLHKKGDLDSSHFCDIWAVSCWPIFGILTWILHLHDFSFFSQNNIPFLRSRASLCFPLPLTLPAFPNNVVFLIYPWELFTLYLFCQLDLSQSVCRNTQLWKTSYVGQHPSHVLADPSNMKNAQQCTSFTVETTLRVFIWRGFKHRAKYNICWINNASHEVI